MQAKTVYGVYKDRAQVEQAVETLRANGFRSTIVSVLFPEHKGTKDFADENHTGEPDGSTGNAEPETSNDKMGGAFAWLAGIGALIPGIGPFIAAESWGMLVGAGGDGKPPTLIRAIASMGIPDYEAQRYEDLVKHGERILLAVRCDNSYWAKQGVEILKSTGAEHIGSSGEVAPEPR